MSTNSGGMCRELHRWLLGGFVAAICLRRESSRVDNFGDFGGDITRPQWSHAYD